MFATTFSFGETAHTISCCGRALIFNDPVIAFQAGKC